MTATRIGGHSRTLAAVLAAIWLALAGDAAAQTLPRDDARPSRSVTGSDPQAVALFRTAAALQNRELDDLAAAEWAAFLEQFPHDRLAGKARFYRGLCLIRLQRSAEAESELARVLADHPDLEPELLEQAYANLGLAQYNRAATIDGDEQAEAFDAAIATLGDSLRHFPAGRFAPQVHFYRAEAYRARDDFSAAAQSYEALVSDWPEHPLRAAALYGWGATLQKLAERGRVSLATGDLPIESKQPVAKESRPLQHALAAFDQFLAEFPEHELAAEVHFRRAAIRHEMGLYEEALADATAFLAFEPTAVTAERADALLLRGLCEATLDRPLDAMRTFRTLLGEHPKYRAADRALYELAWAYEAVGDAEQAASIRRRLAMEHADSSLAADCCFRVGLWQLETKDLAGAVRSFAGARDRAGAKTLKEKAAHQLGWTHFRLAQFAEAEQAFADQLTDSPDGLLAADARLMIGEARFARQEYAAALAAYAAAVEDRGGSAELRELALMHAAQSAAQLKDWSQSIALLDRCEQDFPETAWRPQIHYERGRALYHRQQYDAARRDFEAVATGGDAVLGARAAFMIGEIHFARQEYDAAVRQFFKVAYAPGPADEAVAHWRAESLFEAARCLEQTERFDSAGKLYRELVERYPESQKARHARIALDELNTRKR